MLTVGLILISLPLAAQEPEMVTDPEAYALYSLLVPRYWNRRMEGRGQAPPLQRETEAASHRCENPKAPNEEWRICGANFHQQTRAFA